MLLLYEHDTADSIGQRLADFYCKRSEGQSFRLHSVAYPSLFSPFFPFKLLFENINSILYVGAVPTGQGAELSVPQFATFFHKH